MVIDLSHDIGNGMPFVQGDPKPAIELHLDYLKDHCRVTRWTLGSHTGTHIDAPSHFFVEGASLSDYPVTRFFGRGVLMDLTHFEPNEVITPEDISPLIHHIQPGDFVILHTGWDRWWGSPTYEQHPSLSFEAARLLVRRQAALVAIDALSIENAPDDLYPVHELLLGHEIFIVENLCRLDKIGEQTGEYFFLPLKVIEADGSPVRAMFRPYEQIG
jgi:arylformamidase